jgi:hypothetical protein
LSFGNNIYVTTNLAGTQAASSTDGINWSLRTLPASNSFRGGSFGNGIFFVPRQSSSYGASSTDGITWTIRTLPSIQNWNNSSFGTPPAINQNLNYIVYNSSIPGNSTVTIKNPYTLTYPNGIKIASTNGTCTFTTFGTEIS